MDDELPRLPDALEPEEDDAEAVVPLPSLPPEVTSGDEELRRMIDAGASTPEELRELAARIREHREREDALWRDEVRPALKKAKKRKFQLGDLVERPDDPPTTNGAFYGFVIGGVVVVLVLAATQSSIVWALIPLVAVLGYAYFQGRREDGGDAGDATSPPDEDASG